jgi:hypothetical protein
MRPAMETDWLFLLQMVVLFVIGGGFAAFLSLVATNHKTNMLCHFLDI